MKCDQNLFCLRTMTCRTFFRQSCHVTIGCIVYASVCVFFFEMTFFFFTFSCLFYFFQSSDPPDAWEKLLFVRIKGTAKQRTLQQRQRAFALSTVCESSGNAQYARPGRIKSHPRGVATPLASLLGAPNLHVSPSHNHHACGEWPSL